MAKLIFGSGAREALNNAGWQFVGRKRRQRVARLQELLDHIYVDSRRKAQLAALEEARQIVREL